MTSENIRTSLTHSQSLSHAQNDTRKIQMNFSREIDLIEVRGAKARHKGDPTHSQKSYSYRSNGTENIRTSSHCSQHQGLDQFDREGSASEEKHTSLKKGLQRNTIWSSRDEPEVSGSFKHRSVDTSLVTSTQPRSSISEGYNSWTSKDDAGVTEISKHGPTDPRSSSHTRMHYRNGKIESFTGGNQECC
jgi:hypothetical protein